MISEKHLFQQLNTVVPKTATYYFSVAGFNFKLYFTPTFWNEPKKVLKGLILFVIKDFLLEKRPRKIDFTITVRERRDFLVDPRKRNYIVYFDQISETKIITYYDISVTLFQLILRDALVGMLAKNNGFMLHASANNILGKADLFIGPSGAGKSTAARLIHPKFPQLSDDNVIIKRKNKRFFIYQSPAIEKEPDIFRSSNAFPIGRIFFLKKSKDFQIIPCGNKQDIAARFLKQIWMGETGHKKQLAAALSFLSESNKFFILSFAKDSDKLSALLLHENK